MDNEENKALMGKKEDDEEISYAPSSGYEDSSLMNKTGQNEKEFDEDKFIWSKKQLEYINKKRTRAESIPVVTRLEDSHFGIRANKKMSAGKCFFSLVLPFHNEWVNLLLYGGFAVYMWIECVFIAVQSQKDYDFNNTWDFYYMFIVTFGIATTLTLSFIYYLLYSIGEGYKSFLVILHKMGMYFVTYCVCFAFVSSEDANTPVCFFLQFLAPVFLIASLILTATNDICRIIAFWITVAFVLFVFLADLIFFASRREIRVFYVPIAIEILTFMIGVTLWFFNLPNRWCKDSKFIALYLHSDIIFSLFIVNFLFEIQNILYYTFKANANYLNDDDMWWKIKNIYN